MPYRFRYVPRILNVRVRAAIGFVLLLLSILFSEIIFDEGQFEVISPVFILAWFPAVLLTDKYIHKYPQRYFSYLISSHLKAAFIMAFLLWIINKIVDFSVALQGALWKGFILFVVMDTFVSAFHRRDVSQRQSSSNGRFSYIWDNNLDQESGDELTGHELASINTKAILKNIPTDLDKPIVEFIEKNLPSFQGDCEDVLTLDDIPITNSQIDSAPVGLLIGGTRINDVHRLNMFMVSCVNRIIIGGYFVVRYLPLENVAKDLKHRYSGLLYWFAFFFHYIWYRALPKIPYLDTLYFSSKISWLDSLYLSLNKRRNRALPKAEVWGRLAYCGMQVVAESKGDGEIYLIAQRIALPFQGKNTSYYPIVALEKVGLNGEIIKTHKIRTMFPFSEFLQKRIFEDHGLATSGKFKNDFRLTGFGKFLRKYWLDELPQIFDWLRGDIKLVGMRATSPHFLSLYPKEFYNLYVQVKPGLIPPIFDESTEGFEQIVEVELAYLRSYWEKPFRTDVRYFIKTFTDILLKGVRSR